MLYFAFQTYVILNKQKREFFYDAFVFHIRLCSLSY